MTGRDKHKTWYLMIDKINNDFVTYLSEVPDYEHNINLSQNFLLLSPITHECTTPPCNVSIPPRLSTSTTTEWWAPGWVTHSISQVSDPCSHCWLTFFPISWWCWGAWCPHLPKRWGLVSQQLNKGLGALESNFGLLVCYLLHSRLSIVSRGGQMAVWP